MVPVSLISNGLVCSAQVVMFQVYSAWQCQCFLVGCYLTKVSISSIKYPGFKMSGSHTRWELASLLGPYYRNQRTFASSWSAENKYFPLFLILLADLLKHFKGAIVWLPPSFCHYRSSLLGFALFHPTISGFYLPFCMDWEKNKHPSSKPWSTTGHGGARSLPAPGGRHNSDSSYLADNHKMTSINAQGPPQRLHSQSFLPPPGPPPAAGPPGVSASRPWLH